LTNRAMVSAVVVAQHNNERREKAYKHSVIRCVFNLFIVISTFSVVLPSSTIRTSDSCEENVNQITLQVCYLFVPILSQYNNSFSSNSHRPQQQYTIYIQMYHVFYKQSTTITQNKRMISILYYSFHLY
jgi:hypothetical protein